jgi:hypothetical protein
MPVKQGNKEKPGNDACGSNCLMGAYENVLCPALARLKP